MSFLNKPLKVLLLTDALVLVSGAMLVPYYTLFVEKIGGSILDAGIAASLFAVAAGLASLISGQLSDQVKRQELIVASGYIVTAVGFLAFALVSSVWQLMVVQVVIGLAQASYAPAYDTLYTKHLGSKRHISSRWSIWESTNYFSIAIGALVGSLILHFGSFAMLFVAMAGLCGFSALYLVLLPRRILRTT